MIDYKFEQISMLLNTCKNIVILFTQETFLKPSKPEDYNIPGFYMFQKYRSGTKRGGEKLVYIADRAKAMPASLLTCRHFPNASAHTTNVRLFLPSSFISHFVIKNVCLFVVSFVLLTAMVAAVPNPTTNNKTK